MSGNLYITYGAGPPADNGSRPMPTGPNVPPFYLNPGLALDPANGAVDPSTYNPNNTAANPEANSCGVVVEVQSMNTGSSPSAAYQAINVEVWVCEPSTVLTLQQARPPYINAPSPLMAGGGLVPAGANAWPLKISMQNVFYPYQGLVAQPADHVCLIGNVYGSTIAANPGVVDDGESIAQQLITNPQLNPNFASLVQSDGHFAQHNIFAEVMQGAQMQISFPFRAVTSLGTGKEQVSLEIQHATTLSPADLAFLHNGPLKRLPLHPSKVTTIGKVEIHGGQHGPGRSFKQELNAGRSLPLSIEVALAHPDAKGAVHRFDVIQKGPNNQIQGGLRLLAVVDP
jgi:hypothetical protein